uniref:MAGE family member B3 n=1 Tax=Suricata suricatta TaxID=37032 RepID=A0A673V190_SURSU
MPRGQKSKLRAREKRCLNRGETQGLNSALASTAEEDETIPSSSPVHGGASSSSPISGTSQEPQKAPATTKAHVSRRRSKSGAKSQVQESENSSLASTSTEEAQKAPLDWRVEMLVQFMLYKSPAVPDHSASQTRSYKGTDCQIEKKQGSFQPPVSIMQSAEDPISKTASVLVSFLMHMYRMKRRIMKADMLKFINKKYKNRFVEILRRASFSLEVVFGVDIREVDPTNHSYILVSKMELPNNGTIHRGRGFPKTGLLMNLLGVIFLQGNCAAEEKIWEFLNKMRIYAGKRHFIFGEPKKLITQDLVKLKYLEYRQVPNSDPASYEFLWGPRSHAETSKMKVLEFWATINRTVPSAFHPWYEEALRDEEERAKRLRRVSEN